MAPTSVVSKIPNHFNSLILGRVLIVLWPLEIKFNSTVVICESVRTAMLSGHISTLLRPPSRTASCEAVPRRISIPLPSLQLFFPILYEDTSLGSMCVPEFPIAGKFDFLVSPIPPAGTTDQDKSFMKMNHNFLNDLNLIPARYLIFVIPVP